MAAALAYAAPPSHSCPLASEVSTTLSVAAGAAYEIFSDAAELSRWLPIIQAARVLARYPDGRPQRIAFTRKLERGSLSYTLEYTYDPTARMVTWSAPADSSVVLTGEARFVPLSTRACLMLYRLVIDLPIVDDLVHGELDNTALPFGSAASPGRAGLVDGHPASQVVSEFREHLRRLC